MRGPTYKDEELKMLAQLSKEKGTFAERAAKFVAQYPDRTATAIEQKLRKFGAPPVKRTKVEAKTSKTSKAAAKPRVSTRRNGGGSKEKLSRFETPDGVTITGPAKKVAELAQYA